MKKRRNLKRKSTTEGERVFEEAIKDELDFWHERAAQFESGVMAYFVSIEAEAFMREKCAQQIEAMFAEHSSDVSCATVVARIRKIPIGPIDKEETSCQPREHQKKSSPG